ncbi:MAG: PAS domain-containing protein, partial [Deltaproteobacteria bacterium]|nr:PAS domain-containing protein [Deltaproteobacteria bacterium]
MSLLNIFKNSLRRKIMAALVLIVGSLGGLFVAYSSYFEAQSKTHRVMGMLIIMGVAIVTLYFLLYKLIIQRIMILSDATNEIRKGNLDVEIPVVGEDSIGYLADFLRTMVINQKDQEAFNSGLKNRIPVPMYFVDHDMTVTFINPAAQASAGMRAAEIEGKMKCWEVWGSDKCQGECQVKTALKTGKSDTTYIQVIKPPKGAEIQTISASSAPITDSKGKILGAL